jgi:hypothetical protein
VLGSVVLAPEVSEWLKKFSGQERELGVKVKKCIAAQGAWKALDLRCPSMESELLIGGRLVAPA